MEKTYFGRVCLSKEETIRGWKYEHIDGKTRAAAAQEVGASERTLLRMYKRYDLPSPKRLSKEDVIKAWKLEHINGFTRTAVALKLRVKEETLYKMYRKYNLPSSKRGRKKKC